MRFRTEYTPVSSDLRLDPTYPVVLIGSCFADNIARRMRECQWEAFNGCGTLYNPASIAKVLDMLVLSDDVSSMVEDSLFESDGMVHSWLFDTHFSRTSASDCMQAVAEARNALLTSLAGAQALIVTFGTSWCYRLEERKDYIVANCHKRPQAMFERFRLPVTETSRIWIDLCARLKERYPALKVIFTVSPVRHMKDGFEGNSRSKAALLLAVEEICGSADNALYFPAYEIVCDDLRDYRFYASDLVHPSETAVEYIWEIFRKTFIDGKGEQLLAEGRKKFKSLSHRPIARQ